MIGAQIRRHCLFELDKKTIFIYQVDLVEIGNILKHIILSILDMILVDPFILWHYFKGNNATCTNLVDYMFVPSAIWLDYKLD